MLAPPLARRALLLAMAPPVMMSPALAELQPATAPPDETMPMAPPDEVTPAWPPDAVPTIPEPTPPPQPPVKPPEPQGVRQIQANPRGEGVPSMTPPDSRTASDPVPPALPADPTYRAGPYKGALTPPPAGVFNKVYPVCTRTLRDSCRNPGGI